jgi:hypothetical protein
MNELHNSKKTYDTFIVASNDLNIQKLIENWLTEEENGNQFPVDFDIAWQIAGYSRKDNAKRQLPKSSLHKFYLISEKKSGNKGRPKEIIKLSTDGLKHLCLMADTKEGEQIRQYFIEAEKKWKLVEKVDPVFAQEIEVLKLKKEISKNEAIARKSEENILNLRHYVTTSLPEPIQQKILGYQTIKEVEKVETVIDKSTGKSYDGVGITYIAKALGMTNKEAWGFLEKIGYGANSDKWHSELTAVESKKLSRDDFEYIKDVVKDYKQRQLWIGE